MTLKCMQDRKGGFTKFMNKKKVHDQGSYLFVYIYLFLVVIIFSHIVVLLAKINFFHTDIHNAREMLGVLFESQATIIALVITLTLVAVQLTASEYSPRVVDIFRKDPYMWTLFILYGISMLYDLILLKLVEGGEMDVVDQSVIWSYGPVPISLEWLVSSALLFGTFTFFALIPFILHTINLLKPKNIINQLANEITKNKLLNSKEDRIQPIVDIIRGSIMNYDFETTRKGLEAVTNQVINVIDSNCDEKISNSFCNRLQELGKLAASLTDEESAMEVIENLEKFGKGAAEKGLEEATTRASSSLCYVGKGAAKKGLEETTTRASSSLGNVGKAAVENKLKEATVKTVAFLEDVGKTAANFGEKFEDATIEAEKSLKGIGVDAAKKATEEKELGVIPDAVASSLNVVGKIAKEKGLNKALELAKSYLSEVIEEAENRGLDVMTRTIGSTQEES